MPRLKKICKAGRPKSNYSQMNDEEIREYHAEAMNKSRKSKSPAVLSHEKSPIKMSRGRPPLDKMLMSPNTLKIRKRHLGIQYYKKKKRKEKSNNAIKIRWAEMEGEEVGEVGEADEAVGEGEGGEEEECEVEQEKVEFIDKEFSKSKFYRYATRLVGMFDKNPINNLKIFLSCVPEFKHLAILPPKIDELGNMGSLSNRQLKYRKKRLINEILRHFNCYEIERELFCYWIERLMTDDLIATMILENWNLPSNMIPKSVAVSNIAQEIGKDFLKRHNSSEAQRVQGIYYVVAVAKKSNLDIKSYGDIALLCRATSCSQRFAKSVLTAIANNNVNDLSNRNLRCDSIKATVWPNEIVKYVLMPENSRAVPGQTSVSVRYGVRKPKYVLLHSKEEIAKGFKNSFPDCTFTTGTIIREFPQNAITATSREMERNTCPYHANMRRLLRCLHSNKIATDIPLSCRQMCGLSLCKYDDVILENPLTWRKDCVEGVCKGCTSPEIEVPSEIANAYATYSNWMKGDRVQKETKKDKNGKKRKQKVKIKKVYSLFPVTDKLKNITKTFIDRLPKLKQHIYTAHKQWQAHAEERRKLKPGSIITIEDYQRNIEIEYWEKPTSKSYAANTLTVAVYPICIEYVDKEGNLKKGAIVFISDDKMHDHQQVKHFEKRMFEIIREDNAIQVSHWSRWTDGCGAQFKSRYATADLKKASLNFDLVSSTFSFFESHEGKNTSDTIGSIVKCAFVRALGKKDEGILNAEGVVKLLHTYSKEETVKFEFFRIEEFPFIDRIPESERDEFVINGITKFHRLVAKDDGILADDISCLDCTVDKLCTYCDEKDFYCDNDSDDETESDEEQVEDEDEDDLGCTDEEMTDVSDDDEEADVSPGSIVWAKYGKRYYPAKVVCKSDLPENLKTGLFRKQKASSVIVKWYGENNFSWVKVANIEDLAENKIDSSRASVNEEMMQKYQFALADLRND